MTLALHLPTQLWPLLDLVLAIFQPAVILLLCAGFVLASIHLLTMFSTRWGDKRVSTKALCFSLGLHATLLCGVVALIPEYRPQMIVTSFLPEDGIQVNSVSEAVQTGFDASESGASGRPVWDRVDAAVTFDAPRTVVSAPSLPPSELAHVELPRPDRPIAIPEPDHAEAAPVPTESSELVAANAPRISEPASREMPLDEILPSLPQEPSTPRSPITRSSIPRDTMPVDSTLTRVDRQSIGRVKSEVDPDVETSSIAAVAQPESTLPSGPSAEEITRREGPAPYQMAEPSETPEINNQIPGDPSPGRMAMPRSIPRPARSSIPGELSRLDSARPLRPIPRDGSENDNPDQGPELMGPIEAPPLLMQPELSPSALVSNSTPAQYILRNSTNRGQAVEQFGGTVQSEAAVDLALKWLASIQEADGSFDGDSQGAGRVAIEVNSERDGRNADAGLTALTVLAFLGKQHTLEEGEYSANVERALRWLVSQQGQNLQGIPGYLGGQKASNIAGMYSHALATFAMAEAFAMTKDESRSAFLKEPLRRGGLYPGMPTQRRWLAVLEESNVRR